MTAPTYGSAADLLAELDALGIQFVADGERLRFRPREAVTAELAARIKTHKVELLASLRKRDALGRRLAAQLAELVPYMTPDGRQVLVNPRYLEELDNAGLL